MGILSTVFFYVIPGTSFAVYLSFRLGPELPIACRIMGMGLCYYTFKALLKLNLPKDIVKSNELIKLMRQSEQQANALNREMRQSFYEIKKELREGLPEEMKQNPFKMLANSNYRKSEKSLNSIFGSQTILESLIERERMRQNKMEKGRIQGFLNKL